MQNRYSFADRESDFIVDYCEENETAFFPWAPIGQARPLNDVIRQVAAAALRFSAPGGTGVASQALKSYRADPGTASVSTWKRIVAAALELPNSAFERFLRYSPPT